MKEDAGVAKALVAYLETITKARPISINTKLTGYVEVVVGYDARIVITDSGIRVTSVRLTRRDTEILSNQVAAFLDKVGKKMGPERAVKNVKKTFGDASVLSDQRMSNGSRVVRLRI